MQPDVEAAVRAAIAETGAARRAIIVPISLPYTKYALPTYYIIAPAECSANLARFDGVKYGYSHQAGDLRDSYELTRGEGFGPEVKRRIMLGTYALSSGYYDAYYIKAQKTRTLIKRDFDEAFTSVDADRRGDLADRRLQDRREGAGPAGDVPDRRADDPRQYGGHPRHLAHLRLHGGLPIALQVLGPAFGEEICLRVAHAYEQATPWKDRLADP